MNPATIPIAALLLDLAIALSGQVASPGSTARVQLDYGPHAVGFRVIEAYDSTRAFRAKRDFQGRLATGPIARPVQISLWYPAVPDSAAPRMSAGDFRLLAESEVDFEGIAPAEAERLRAAFVETAARFGTPEDRAEALWYDPIPAARDAAPLPGPHAAVIYFTAAGVSNPLLPTYLASHGFVVASFPSNGRMTEVSLEFFPNALTLDTDIDDAGFVYAWLRRLDFVDTDHLAVVSFSSGSLAALLWHMRDLQADAIVAMESWEQTRRGADIVSASVHYDPGRVRIPYLRIDKAAPESSPAYARVPDVLEALSYAEITRFAFRDAAHGDFLSHSPGLQSEAFEPIYATAALTIRLFLQARLNGDAAAAERLAGLKPPAATGADFFIRSVRAAQPPVPSEEELFRLAETDPGELARVYRAVSSQRPGDELFREHVLVRAAIFAEAPADRVTILRVVVDAYPRSVSARYRLGTALQDAGREEDGRRVLGDALELVDDDPSLEADDREAWRERIREALSRR